MHLNTESRAELANKISEYGAKIIATLQWSLQEIGATQIQLKQDSIHFLAEETAYSVNIQQLFYEVFVIKASEKLWFVDKSLKDDESVQNKTLTTIVDKLSTFRGIG